MGEEGHHVLSSLELVSCWDVEKPAALTLCPGSNWNLTSSFSSIQCFLPLEILPRVTVRACHSPSSLFSWSTGLTEFSSKVRVWEILARILALACAEGLGGLGRELDEGRSRLCLVDFSLPGALKTVASVLCDMIGFNWLKGRKSRQKEESQNPESSCSSWITFIPFTHYPFISVEFFLLKH